MAKYPAHEDHAWSDAKWSVADDNAQDTAKPTAADDATLTTNSKIVTLTGDEAGANLDMTGVVAGPTGGIGATGARNLDVGGNVIWGGYGGTDITLYCAGSFTAVAGHVGAPKLTALILDGTGTLTTNAVTLGPIEMNSAGTITLADDLACSTLTLTAGTWNDGGNDITVAGDLEADGAIAGTNTGIWSQTASGNLKVDDAVARPGGLVIAGTGITSTLTGGTWGKKLTTGSGTVALGNFNLTVYPVATSGFLDIDGTTVTAGTGLLSFYYMPDASTIPSFAWNSGVQISSANTRTVNGSGTWALGTNALRILCTGAGTMTVDLGGAKLTCGDVNIGSAAADANCAVLNLGSGSRIISGSVGRSRALQVANELHFDSAYVEASGAIDLAGIASTNTAAHIVNPQGGAGSIDNVPNIGGGEPIHCYGITDGGANHADSVDFDKHAPPGSMGMMGVGI